MRTRRLQRINAFWCGLVGVLALAGAMACQGQVLLSISPAADNNVELDWPDCGVLQTTTDLTQPWVNVPSATSPYLVSISENSQFFRLAPLNSTALTYMGTNDMDTNAACMLEVDPVNLEFQFFATNGIFGETDFGFLDDETVDLVQGTNGAPDQYLLSGTYGDLSFVGVVDLCPDYTGYIEIIQEGVIKIIYRLGLGQVHIDGDGDHDGTTSDSAADRAGKDINPGCITFNNLDNHPALNALGNPNRLPDNQTSVIQGAGHQAEMAQIIVRRIPIIPAGWSVTLRLHNVQNGEGAYAVYAGPGAVAGGVAAPAVGVLDVVRILSANPGPVAPATSFGTTILGGPGGNTSWTLPANDPSLVDLTTLKAGQITLYAEGLTRAFAAAIKLSLELRDAGNNLISSDELQVKVSPLMFLPNTINATVAYASQVNGLTAAGAIDPTKNNNVFCAAFDAALPGAPNAVTGQTIPGLAGAAMVLNGSYDVWARDQFKIGYQQAPFQRAGMVVVLNSKRDRGLQAFPPTLLGPGIGYMAPITTPGLPVFSKDSFGNLEVSPPCSVPIRVLGFVVGRANYPLGRIYYGGGGGAGADAMDPRLVDFLNRQGVQSPVQLYSDWLLVGHVDEFMSIVPDPAASQGWRVLLADSAIAKDIFFGRVGGLQNIRPLVNFKVPQYASIPGAAGVPAIKTLLDLLLHPLEVPVPAVAAVPAAPGVPAVAAIPALEDIWDWNFNNNPNGQRAILAGLKTSIQNAFGLAPGDFTSVPVLFDRVPDPAGDGKSDAFTPDLVNGAVYQGDFIAPDDYVRGPNNPTVPKTYDPFQTYFNAVAPAALSPITYIDDWQFYHLALGEVHCGTNERRVIPIPPQWPLWWNN